MGTKPDMHMDVGAGFGAGGKPGGLAGLAARLRALLADRSDTAVAQKVAGSAFLIRVVNAGIAFASQILLARWMGQTEYGVYVYVWTWVLLLGGLTSLGLASAPQRFIPEYSESGELKLLRGFLLGSRVMAMAISTSIAVLGLGGIWLFAEHLESWTVIPLYLALVCVPMYVLTDVQDGIARSHNWIDVALAPAYFVRPLLILALLGALSYEQFAPTATTAMAATVIATWATSLAQLLMLGRRLKRKVPPGPRAYAPKTWMKVSLPIFMVEGFYLLLAYTDVLILSAFHPPHDVAVYYAAVKVMSLVAFVSFSVSAAVAHRFTEYAVAGDHARLATMVRDAARWTFWPSLAGCAILLAVGWPILWLFGSDFTEGYQLLYIIAVGLLARSVVGPLERLLNMLGQQNICASVYGGAFALNVALCFTLVPDYGMTGAAIATSITQVAESVILFWITRRRLGLGALPWGRGPAPHPNSARIATGDAVTDMLALPMPTGDELVAPMARAEPVRFELTTIEALAKHRAAWEDLSSRALQRNVFCEADFAIAARHLKSVRNVRLAVVWDALAPERLLGVVPVVSYRIMPGLSGQTSAHWAYFGALGAPMVDRERASLAIEGLLDGLSEMGQSLFLFRFLPESGPTADAVRAAVAFTGRSLVRIESHGRAMLRSNETAEGYLTASLSAKKLKELRRQFRRLADDGPTSWRESRSPEDVAAALERFLELEAAGWKGESRSAMRFHEDQLQFVRELFAGRAGKGEARVLELFVGEKLVSAGLVLTSGRQAWFYKVAYDEGLSRCSPGVQLTLELTRRMLDDPGIDAVDSTAIANHPMIDHVWRERLVLGDWMIALSPGAARLLPLAARTERARRAARLKARNLYHRLKDRSR
ncbi:GNAT family N-acetyltransferase [Hansschlegelia zhihuaiae]|nr:GNAT family N-acetyltransferase [Hansschlegelia zhihuaiae]